ncbi:hypothetical protein CBL_13655 [Carabus blaptoides fortunei]
MLSASTTQTLTAIGNGETSITASYVPIPNNQVKEQTVRMQEGKRTQIHGPVRNNEDAACGLRRKESSSTTRYCLQAVLCLLVTGAELYAMSKQWTIVKILSNARRLLH